MKKVKMALKLYKEGLSIRSIAQMLGVSHTTVSRWLRRWKEGRLKEGKKGRAQKEGLPEELKKKLKKLLEYSKKEKLQSRVLSLRSIYNALEIELRAVGINSLHSFYRYVKQFIQQEYGSLEKLEAKRRDRREKHQYKKPKGSIERRKGWIEVDATGYTLNNKQYSIILAQDEETGFILGYLVIENREKEAKYYNKAFSELDYMYFLLHIFKEFGVPVGIKTDNERFLIGKNVRRALQELGIELQRTKPYNPQSKLIERSIRDIKEKIRLTIAISPEKPINEIVEEVINLYNKKEHNYTAGTWIPTERFSGYEKVEEDTLRLALSIEEERAIINGYIRLDNKTYEFHHPELEKDSPELGRKPTYPKVKVRIDLEDNTKAWVFKDEKVLGIARLITTAEETLLEEKQIKQQAKRIEKKKKALQEELQKIEDSMPQKIEKQRENIFDLLTQQTQPEKKEEAKEDILELLLGGEK